MLHLGSQKENLEVIYDQIGTPTYARDLAKTCLKILTGANSVRISKGGNLYHYSNEGVASWYDFALAIMELGEQNCKVKPIQTKDYPTLAKRPHFSVLNKIKIKTDFDIQIPHWKSSLKECIKKIKN
jgi:dTDP-4-dehydrorhamnose reductase